MDEERAILESLKNFYSMGRAIFCLNPPQTNIAGVGSEGIGLFLTWNDKVKIDVSSQGPSSRRY